MRDLYRANSVGGWIHTAERFDAPQARGGPPATCAGEAQGLYFLPAWRLEPVRPGGVAPASLQQLFRLAFVLFQSASALGLQADPAAGFPDSKAGPRNRASAGHGIPTGPAPAIKPGQGFAPHNRRLQDHLGFLRKEPVPWSRSAARGPASNR